MQISEETRYHLEYRLWIRSFPKLTPTPTAFTRRKVTKLTAGIILVVLALGVLIGVPVLWGSTHIARNSPAPVVYGWFALLTLLMLGALVYAIIVSMSIPL